MADVMVERIRSIERTAGFGFVLGSLLLTLALFLYPKFPQVNQASLVLEAISKERGESWMQLHALMVLGFVLLAVGLIGEYIGRIYLEVRRRPTYIVRAVHGDESASPERR